MAGCISRIMHSSSTTCICIVILIGIYGTRFSIIDLNEIKLLPTTPSPHGGYSEWGPWSSCYCGRMIRNRTCTNPVPKPNGRHCAELESSVDVKMCNVTSNCRQDGGWSVWAPWSSCNPKCKQTLRYAIKLCDNPPPMYGGSPCKDPVPRRSKLCEQYPICLPIDGGLGKWGAWSTCSKTCDEGIRNRKRKCNNPEPKFDGKDCNDTLIEHGMCVVKNCV